MTHVLALFALLLLVSPAAAAPSRAETLLARGEALTRAGNAGCDEPLMAAALASEADDGAYARALGALGLCRETQGRFGDAHRLVSRALEAAPPETAPAGRAPRWATLREALHRLDGRVARVLVTWEEGVELYLDRKAVDGVSGCVLAVDPGRRLFEARRGGRTVAAQEVEARTGDLPAVHLESAESCSAEGKCSRADIGAQGLQPRQITTSTRTTSSLVPALSPRGLAVGTVYTAGGVALVAGVVAGVLEAQRVSLRSGLAADACPTPDASPRCAELRQVFEQSRGARNAALVAAGVAVAAGGVVVALRFAAKKDAPSQTGVIVRWLW